MARSGLRRLDECGRERSARLALRGRHRGPRVGFVVAVRRERGGQIDHGREAGSGLERERPMDGVGQIARQSRAQRIDPRGLLLEKVKENGRRVVPRVGLRSGQQLVEDHAHGVDVRTNIERPVPARLLRRHVVRRSESRSGVGDAAGLVDQLRDTEVEDLDELPPVVATHDEDVPGLEVAVEDAVRVSRLQPAAHSDVETSSPTVGASSAFKIAAKWSFAAFLMVILPRAQIPYSVRPASRHDALAC